MTPTTREIALAAMKQAGLDRRVDMDALYAFWSLAMEHAAGIADDMDYSPDGAIGKCIREAGK